VLVRPQRRRQMQQANMLSSLQPGVEIVTAGGLYGEVIDVDLDGDEIQLEIAPGIVVRVAKRAVAAVIPEETEEDEEYDDEDDDELEGEAERAHEEPETETAEPEPQPAAEEAQSGTSRR
jgi:preprotein translocase subunit YajC